MAGGVVMLDAGWGAGTQLVVLQFVVPGWFGDWFGAPGAVVAGAVPGATVVGDAGLDVSCPGTQPFRVVPVEPPGVVPKLPGAVDVAALLPAAVPPATCATTRLLAWASAVRLASNAATHVTAIILMSRFSRRTIRLRNVRGMRRVALGVHQPAKPSSREAGRRLWTRFRD